MPARERPGQSRFMTKVRSHLRRLVLLHGRKPNLTEGLASRLDHIISQVRLLKRDENRDEGNRDEDNRVEGKHLPFLALYLRMQPCISLLCNLEIISANLGTIERVVCVV